MTLRDTTVETYAVDSVTNQYDESGTFDVTHTYDAAGNMTADHRGYSYSYDYENRLVRIQEGAGTVAEYVYDALGRRIKAGGKSYYYDGGWHAV